MGRQREITKGKLVDGIIEIKLTHWKHFPKLITRDLLDYPSYIFRGQTSAVWPLESSFDRVVRKKKINKPEPIKHLNAFKNASKGRRGKNPQHLDSEDEWWALGQHYGLVTPLLDFTRSAFVALYFSFWDESFTGADRAVYALHFYNLNKKMNDITDEKERVKIFYPVSDENERLINQSALFVKMPIATDLETVVKKNFKDYKNAILVKIIIPNKDVKNCLTMLNKMNINHSTLFPDLYGAASFVNCILGKDTYDNIQLLNL